MINDSYHFFLFLKLLIYGWPLKTDMKNPNYNINLGHRLHITHIDDSDTESEVLDFTRGPPIQGQPIFDFQSNRNFGTSQFKKKII